MTDRPAKSNDAFSFRSGERLTLQIGSVESCQYAVMAAPIAPLPLPLRATTEDGDPVESCCIVAAQMVDGLWQWMQLAVDAKEIVGNALFDNGLEKGVWHGAIIA